MYTSMKIYFLSLVATVVVTTSAYPQQQPKNLDAPTLNTVIYNVSELRLPPPAGVLRISGERRWDGFFLSAEKIEFEPNSKLILTQRAMSQRGQVFILAKDVTSLSQEAPGIITWEEPPLGVPPDRGNAPGAPGGRPDDTGGVGGPTGEPGHPGVRGNDGPVLTLVVGKISNPVVIDVSGQSGGQGGPGQIGGRGGTGGNGHPASQNCCNCNRGAGNGAAGGPGGRGGKGGPGGLGGNGGTLTLVTSSDNYPVATRLLRADLSPGNGGGGGQGGQGGPGGDGGSGGQESRPWCRGNGSQGGTGGRGGAGDPGEPGLQGRGGDFLVGSLSVADLDKVLGSR